jgi:hypothetical protein
MLVVTLRHVTASSHQLFVGYVPLTSAARPRYCRMQLLKSKVFGWSGSVWVQIGATLKPIYRSQFGHSLALSKNSTRIAVGATDTYYSDAINDYHCSPVGSIQVYDLINSSWQDVTTFNGKSSFGRLGWAVDMSDDGTKIVAGAPFQHGPNDEFKVGAVHVFEENATLGWSQTAEFHGKSSSSQLGSAVVISGTGDVIAFGAHLDDESFANAGYVHVLYYNGSSTESDKWTQRAGTLHGWGELAQYGESLGISRDGSHLIVGAPRTGAPDLENPTHQLHDGRVTVYNIEIAQASTSPMPDLTDDPTPAEAEAEDPSSPSSTGAPTVRGSTEDPTAAPTVESASVAIAIFSATQNALGAGLSLEAAEAAGEAAGEAISAGKASEEALALGVAAGNAAQAALDAGESLDTDAKEVARDGTDASTAVQTVVPRDVWALFSAALFFIF